MERLEGVLLDGKYRVLRRVGVGGMGEVYQGVHEGTERPVAIKMLSAELAAASPEADLRFRREARAAGRIGHDNICEVIDVGRMASGAPYLVMPLLRGQLLADLIDRAAPLPTERSIDIMVQVLSALAAAHKVGLVHRDLKPDNVFLVRMGDREDFVKVLDFGIAKPVDEPIDGTLTRSGTVLGTPCYMSPEQAQGMADLDGRADQFAAGIMLYEMVTGRRPFGGKNYNQIITAILLAPCSPPRALRPDLPAAVEAVIMRALSRDRADRYPDAAEMQDALLAAVRRTTPPNGRVASGGGAGFTDASGAATHVCAAATEESRPVPDVAARPGSAPSVTGSQVVPGRRTVRARPFILSGLAVLAVTVTATVILLNRTEAEPSARDRTPSALPAGPPTPAVASATVPPLPPRPPAVETVSPSEPDAGHAAFVPDAAPPTPLPVATVEPAVDAAAVPDGPALSRTVRLALTGLPEGARVAVDGREVDGPSFSVPRTDGFVSVAVSAPGYLPWRRSVSARTGATIPVRLLRRTGTVVRTMPADPPARDAGSSSLPEPGDGGDAAHRHVPTFGAGP